MRDRVRVRARVGAGLKPAPGSTSCSVGLWGLNMAWTTHGAMGLNIALTTKGAMGLIWH